MREVVLNQAEHAVLLAAAVADVVGFAVCVAAGVAAAPVFRSAHSRQSRHRRRSL